MTMAEAFFDTRSCDPFDPAPMLIHADWLEEQGDLVGAKSLRALAGAGVPSLVSLALDREVALFEIEHEARVAEDRDGYEWCGEYLYDGGIGIGEGDGLGGEIEIVCSDGSGYRDGFGDSDGRGEGYGFGYEFGWESGGERDQDYGIDDRLLFRPQVS